MPALIRRPAIVVLTGCCLFLCAPLLPAQSPTISSTSPLAVQPGGTVDVTVRGGNLAGAKQLWTSFPAQTQLAPGVKDNGKNNAQTVFRVNVPNDAAIGVHGVRVGTDRGVSALKLFVVDDLPSVAAKGDCTTIAKAQSVPSSIGIDGSVAALTRYYFAFDVKAGQKLSFEVLARRIGSALDPMIRILDPTGREIAYNDDALGLNGDAQLVHTFKNPGKYTLELRDIRFQGGGNYQYRVRIGDFPLVTAPYPMAVQRGKEAQLQFAGTDTGGVEAVKFKAPAKGDWTPVAAKRKGGTSSGMAMLRLADRPQFSEKEPNDENAKANRVALGDGLNGRLQKNGDIDRFVFAAKKGQRFVFDAVTRRQGAPSDLIIQLLNGKGAKVAEAEDSGNVDGTITYTFPADGDYYFSVEDLHRRGGGEFAYRVAVTESKPGFKLSASADSIVVPAGGTGQITVDVSRSGYNGAIEISATNLPEGIESISTIIGPGRNSVVLTLRSTGKKPEQPIAPVTIVGIGKQGQLELKSSASIATVLQGANNGLSFPPQTLTAALAAGVGPDAPFKLRVEPAQVVFGRNLTAKFKVIIERGKGFDEQITLGANPLPKKNPKQGGLPPGATIAFKPIPKGKNEIELTVTANDKVPVDRFTATIVATHKKGKATTTQYVPNVTLKLEAPMSVSADAVPAKLKPGGKKTVKVKVDRNPSLTGPITVALEKLPTGVTAAKATIPPGKNEIDVVLTAAAKAAKAAAKTVTVLATATVGKAKLTARSAAFAVSIE